MIFIQCYYLVLKDRSLPYPLTDGEQNIGMLGFSLSYPNTQQQYLWYSFTNFKFKGAIC